MSENDPMPRADGDDDAPKSRRLSCEFCECSLSSKGEILRMSARAKELRKLEDAVDALKEKIADRDSAITSLRAELAEAQAAAKAATKGDDNGPGRVSDLF